MKQRRTVRRNHAVKKKGTRNNSVLNHTILKDEKGDAMSDEVITQSVESPKEEDKKKEIRTEVLIQFSGLESNLADAYQRVKDAYVASGNSLDSIKEIKLYIKPQDFTAYYVINGDYTGKVGLF